MFHLQRYFPVKVIHSEGNGMTCVDFTGRRLFTKWRKSGYELQMQIAPGKLLSYFLLSSENFKCEVATPKCAQNTHHTPNVAS